MQKIAKEAIANDLRRRCELYEAQRGDSQPHVFSFRSLHTGSEIKSIYTIVLTPRVFQRVDPMWASLFKYF